MSIDTESIDTLYINDALDSPSMHLFLYLETKYPNT